MCILFLALRPTGRYVLVAASNRDEFFVRKTLPAVFWDDYPSILAGRDIETEQHGGTWLGVSKEGKFSALTNFRSLYGQYNPAAKSRDMSIVVTEVEKARMGNKLLSGTSNLAGDNPVQLLWGHLVSEFLQSGAEVSSLGYCKDIFSHAKDYNGFSLITVNLSPTLEAAYVSNEEGGTVHSLQSGIYGLSNDCLDSPWKKVTQGKGRFTALLTALEDGSVEQKESEQQLFDLLYDDTCLYPDPNVPSKGFAEDHLKALNSIFVSPIDLLPTLKYGTRTNTVVMVSQAGEVTYTERTRVQPVDLTRPQWQTSTFTFNIHNHPHL